MIPAWNASDVPASRSIQQATLFFHEMVGRTALPLRSRSRAQASTDTYRDEWLQAYDCTSSALRPHRVTPRHSPLLLLLSQDWWLVTARPLGHGP
jgi:hypothetical protein